MLKGLREKAKEKAAEVSKKAAEVALEQGKGKMLLIATLNSKNTPLNATASLTLRHSLPSPQLAGEKHGKSFLGEAAKHIVFNAKRAKAMVLGGETDPFPPYPHPKL